MRRREKGRFTAGGAAMPLAFLLIAYPLFPTAWTSAPIAAAESLGRANFRPTHTILEPERKTGSHVNNLYGK
ncbi:MAG TPA: hypothetical protein VGV87_13405, partial [Blastocatellia bacterium]|nr:hypothetical protein [Blastocatellia bacterium]